MSHAAAAEREALLAATVAATNQPYRPGNRITILQNGDSIFPAMLDAIRHARTSIEFCTYVYWKSGIASEFADALIDRATDGVTVRLLVDAVGGAVMDTRTLWRLERAGVQVAWFRPVRWPYIHKLNNRTHRKILIVDGSIGFTGGVGIAAEWTGAAQDASHWRETHCRLDGPACADLLAGFAENWREARREPLELNRPLPEPAGDIAVQTTISTAGRHQATPIDQLFGAVFAHARHRLWITTAYFVPSPAIMGQLRTAAIRGVDVRILTNGPLSNHKITRLAGRASYGPLLAAGIRIYEYQPTVLHTKIIIADGHWGTVGSANLDGRSLIHNDELNIAFSDPTIAGQLEAAFEADLGQSQAISLAHWRKRAAWERLAERGTFVIRGQL
ncbi:MAG TPA: phospholipase D-like domain-containing protein [Candidatus Saccharimonadia bacterium]